MLETGDSGPFFQPAGTATLKYNSIQFLRCVAVIAVLVFHSHWVVSQKLQNIPLLTNYGWIGVSLFFVISGFIISERIAFERSLGRFLFNRHSPFGVPSVIRPRASGISGRPIPANRDCRPIRIVAELSELTVSGRFSAWA
jgi:hypothetical protein